MPPNLPKTPKEGEPIVLSRSKSAGFTIVEVLVTMLLVGVIAILTIPGIIYKSNDQDALFKSKNMAQILQTAAIQFNKNSPSAAPTTDQMVSDLTNYTLKVTSGSLSTDGPACAAATPCYKFADGGILIPNGWNTATLQGTYYYDPDGTDIRPGVTLIMQYATFRVVPRGAISGIAADDPDYIAPWSGNG